MTPPKDTLLITPEREALLTRVGVAIGSWALFFSGARVDQPDIDDLLHKYLPAPDKFYDGDATVRDARKFFLATLKGAVELLEAST
jgi:hypothetical protein